MSRVLLFIGQIMLISRHGCHNVERVGEQRIFRPGIPAYWWVSSYLRNFWSSPCQYWVSETSLEVGWDCGLPLCQQQYSCFHVSICLLFKYKFCCIIALKMDVEKWHIYFNKVSRNKIPAFRYLETGHLEAITDFYVSQKGTRTSVLML